MSNKSLFLHVLSIKIRHLRLNSSIKIEKKFFMKYFEYLVFFLLKFKFSVKLPILTKYKKIVFSKFIYNYIIIIISLFYYYIVKFDLKF